MLIIYMLICKRFLFKIDDFKLSDVLVQTEEEQAHDIALVIHE